MKTRFQMDHLQWGPHNSKQPNQVSFLLIDCVSNYDIGRELGKLSGVRIRCIYDSFPIQSAIEFTCERHGNTISSDTLEVAYYQSVIADYTSPVNQSNCLPWMLEESPCDIYRVDIYGDTHEEFMDNLFNFNVFFRSSVKEIAAAAEGDDEFFDYAPSYVDEYRQFCTYFKLYKEYKLFVKSLPSDFREEAIYCQEIQPI